MMTVEELAAAMFARMEAATTGNNATAAALWSQAWLAVTARIRVSVPLALPDTPIGLALGATEDH